MEFASSSESLFKILCIVLLQKLVAIKKIQIDEARRSRSRRSVIREANILRTLNHFHIVKCYEWFLEEQVSTFLKICFVMYV